MPLFRVVQSTRMANFIETTLAEAAARKAAAEAVSHQPVTSSDHHDIFYEAAMKKKFLFEKGEKVFKETGIQGTLEEIAREKLKVRGSYVGVNNDDPTISLEKNGHRVEVSYHEDGSVVIQSGVGEVVEHKSTSFPNGVRAQILTAAQLQNNDIIAAALEKAVKNPMKYNRPPPTPSKNYGY